MIIIPINLSILHPDPPKLEYDESCFNFNHYRRDSFITHRAFCDALAQESARHPISLNNLGVHLYGNNQVPALGPSQVTSQNISPIFQDQNPTSNNMLHLGDHSKFKHQIPPSNPYFSGNPLQGPYQSKPFHGLMQLPDLQSNSASHSSINLGFFPSNNNTSTNNIASSSFLHPHDHIFNGEDGSNQGINLFSNNMEDHQVGAAAGISSLLGNSLQQQQPISPHMSATALLQKAAQMGSTTSHANASTLLRNLASSSSSGNKPDHQNQLISPSFGVGAKVGDGLGMQMENESQIQGFMDSLALGGTSFFGGGHGANINVPSFTNVMNDDQSKLHQSLGASRGGNDDNKLTLDFLGVGGMMRKFGGHGANSGNPELKSAQPSHPF